MLLTQRLEEVQNELKLRYDTEETKARLMQVFKEEEAKVKEQVFDDCFLLISLMLNYFYSLKQG